MEMLTLDLMSYLVAAGFGLIGGYWLFRQTASRALRAEFAADRVFLSTAVQRLGRLLIAIEDGVSEHQGRISRIDSHLRDASPGNSEEVLSALSSLIHANQQLQCRLTESEAKLHDQRRLVEEYAAEARMDALTRLANRRAFDEALQRASAMYRRRSLAFSVLLIDLDLFKQVNDRCGHLAGDSVLAGIARLLQHHVRQADIVARYGGEEFAILLADTEADGALHLADRIRRAIAEASFSAAGHTVQITASVGIACVQRGESPPELIQRADDALYQAKQQGRNQCRLHSGTPGLAHAAATAQVTAAPPEDALNATAAEQTAHNAQTPSPGNGPRGDETSAKDADDPGGAAGQEKSLAAGATGNAEGNGFRIPAAAASKVDRTTFCRQLRSALTHWQRGGPRFSLIYMQVRDASRRDTDQIAHVLASLIYEQLGPKVELARCGEGQYAILLAGKPLRLANQLAQQVRDAAATLSLDLPFGVVEVSLNDDMVRILRRAERALQQSVLSKTAALSASRASADLPVEAIALAAPPR